MEKDAQKHTPDPARRLVSFAVSPGLLASLLSLPDMHEIYGAEWDFRSQSLRLYCEGQDLPLVLPGHRIPSCTPVLTRTEDAAGKERMTFDWNFAPESCP